MSNKASTLAVIGAGFALRLLVPYSLPCLGRVLDQSVLFSTPINSYRSLKEALFLVNSQVNPYVEGEIVHHPPLVLTLFRLLQNDWQVTLFFALIDTFMGLQLVSLNKKVSKIDTDKDASYVSPLLVAFLYSFNPLALLTTFARSTYLINNLLVVSALNGFVDDPFGFVAPVCLAISAYLSYYPWYLVIPILAYTYKKSGTSAVLKQLAAFVLVLLALLGLSYQIAGGSFNYLELCYGTILRFKKIIPNLGLWWYFFTEIFDFFARFYLVVFNIYSFIFVVPVTMRFIFPETSSIVDALFALWCIIGIINFSRAYPTITDLNLYFSLTILFQPLYRKLKFPPIVTTLALFMVLLLLPVFYYVWMGLNSGNANFFYAIGLVYNIIELVVLSDFLWAKLQIEYYRLHDVDLKEKLKLTQI